MSTSRLEDLHKESQSSNEKITTGSTALPDQGLNLAVGCFGNAYHECVLVVESDPDIRRVVRKTLESAGYEVIEAEDGEKAIETITTGENPLLIDVVVTAIRMPRINGIELTRYLRNEFPRVAIVVMTGYPPDIELAKNLQKNGDVVDYLVHPIGRESLRDAIAKAFEHRELRGLVEGNNLQPLIPQIIRAVCQVNRLFAESCG